LCLFSKKEQDVQSPGKASPGGFLKNKRGKTPLVALVFGYNLRQQLRMSLHRHSEKSRKPVVGACRKRQCTAGNGCVWAGKSTIFSADGQVLQALYTEAALLYTGGEKIKFWQKPTLWCK
jgi:hypothetical protein